MKPTLKLLTALLLAPLAALHAGNNRECLLHGWPRGCGFDLPGGCADDRVEGAVAGLFPAHGGMQIDLR